MGFTEAFKKGVKSSSNLSTGGFGGMEGLGEALGSNISSISTGLGKLGGSAISDGFQSDAGAALSAIGDIAGLIPGPWGAAIGAGAQVLGGVANKIFGEKVNTARLNDAKAGTSALNNFTSNASSFDDIKGPATQKAVQNAYSTDGWGGHSRAKARRKNNALKTARLNAENFANAQVENNIANLQDTQMSNMLANYNAFGGDLNFGNSPIGYDLYNKYLENQNSKALGMGKMLTSMPNSFDFSRLNTNLNMFSQGGNIHIKPSKKGTFTAAAKRHNKGVQEFASQVLSNKEDYSPAMIKKANFARNASKWHAFGGDISGIADLVNEGGNNVMGYFNLLSDLFGTKKKHDDNTLSDLTEIGNNAKSYGLTAGLPASFLGTISSFANMFDSGGALHTNGANFTNGMTYINNGGSHEKNPYEGVPMGTDQNGIPNLVEEGETIFNDYVFSNRIKVPKHIKEKYKLRSTKPLTFAEASKKVAKESEERPNDPISQRGLEAILSELSMEQEKIKNKNKKNLSENNTFDEGGFLNTSMRYAPVFGLTTASITDALGLTNKEEYDNAKAIIDASRSIDVPQVSYTPLGDYLTYNPFDRNYYINQLNAAAGTTRRNIRNTSGGNRAQALAGLVAADYNANLQLGNLARQAEEYNLAQRQKVKEFNRATNMANAEGFLKAAMANQSARAKAQALGLEAQMKAYGLKESIRQRAEEARSSNLSSLLTSLGNIGKDNMAYNQALITAATNGNEYPDWVKSYLGMPSTTKSTSGSSEESKKPS